VQFPSNNFNCGLKTGQTLISERKFLPIVSIFRSMGASIV